MKKTCLVIIDGFGVAPDGPGNAVTKAQMPFYNVLVEQTPNTLMEASGQAVGLPEGQQGASEPGHLTIGAGRVVWQPFEEINRDIASGDFFTNEILSTACAYAATKDVPLHLMVIASDGGVHGHINHLKAMLRVSRHKGVHDVYVHLFADGRDVSEQSLCTYIDEVEKAIDYEHIGVLVSVVGRYYAMDRDKNWDRTKVAYDLLIHGTGSEEEDLCTATKNYYSTAKENEDTDYYLPPLKTKSFHPIGPDDVVINLNFRSDRERQITAALTDETFEHFDRPVQVSRYICMGPYSDTLPVAFPPKTVENTLGEWLSKQNATQLRVSETEKYAHVTYFFNAQHDEPYPGEDRVHIPSAKVSNYAEKPEMSAKEITDATIEDLKNAQHDCVIVNYANPDLVGHGGDIKAVITACETIDTELERLISALNEAGYSWIITADHGNAEQMLLEDGKPSPSHTTNPVRTLVHAPGITSSDDLKDYNGMKDIAPLVLKLMELPVPPEMHAKL